MGTILGCVFAALVIFAAVILVRTLQFKPVPMAPANSDKIVLNETKIVTDMQDMIRCKTISYNDESLIDFKEECEQHGIKMATLECKIDFSEFKTNADGMVPVVTQNYKTGEVLMLAYMNQEAFEHTIKSGKMTYFSRSRNSLWEKGETSGHYQ